MKFALSVVALIIGTAEGQIRVSNKKPNFRENFPPVGLSCTEKDNDPYSTGSLVACCSGLKKELINDGGNYRYICVVPDCTGLNQDPYQTGSHVGCCSGLNEKLIDDGGNFHFTCITDCTELDQDPYQTGSLVNCCSGLNKVLVNGRYICKSSAALQGFVTMWTEDSPGPLQGSSCETASAAATQQGDAWLVPYVKRGNYCAVSDDVFNRGEGCSKCFKLTYDGNGGTDPGRAGSADIQVVNSGVGGTYHFDCFIDGFRTITGASTGAFPVSVVPISCQDTPTTVAILDGNNAGYVKVVVVGGTTGVAAVDITVGTSTFNMYRVSGGTWAANLRGQTNTNVKFYVTYTDGMRVVVDKCFGSNWPVATGSQCVE